MKEKLYHVSHIEGIKVLEPRVSTHGKSYVYATKNLVVSLLFGSEKAMGDLDGIYGGGTEKCKPYFYEAFPGSFKRRFEDTTCYIYEGDPTDFEEGKTSYRAEVVSEKPVKVLNCTKVENLYEKLLELSKQGELDLRFYDKDDPKYVEMIEQHLKDRIVRYEILEDKEKYQYKFCTYYYPHIIEKLETKSKSNE